MAKKNLYEGELLKTDDWGQPLVKDGVTYDAAAGSAVQNFIKTKLDEKWGCIYDNNRGKYYVFADEESRDLYLEAEEREMEDQVPIPADIAALKLAEMNSYSNYRILISLDTEETMPTNAILVGQTGNKVVFVANTYDNDENPLLEGLTVNYTITRPDGSKTMITHLTQTGKREELTVDKYLNEGQNTVTVNVVGGTSNAIVNMTIVYQVINLKIEDNYDISTIHDISGGKTASLSITFGITGSSVSGKFLEWYLDGVEQPLEATDLVPSGAEMGRITKNTSIDSTFSEGRHNIQYRAWLTVNDQKFYTKTYSKDFIVYNGGTKPIVAIAYEIPIGYDPLTGNTYQNPVIYDTVQYTSFNVPIAVYKNNAANTNTVASLMYMDGGQEKTDVSYTNQVANGEIWDATITPNVSGETTLKIVAGEEPNTDEYEIGIVVDENKLDIHEEKAGLVLDLRAKGKSNTAADRDQWTYDDGANVYTSTFPGFTWDDTSGWNGQELVISNGNSVEVDFKPFMALDVARNGMTFEIEFSTFNVSDDDAVICDMRNDENGAGLIITASEAIFSDNSKNRVSTKFKSNENNRISFVVDPTTQGKPIMLIYVNGAICGGIGYSLVTADFAVDKKIVFSGSPFVSVKLKHIRIYNLPLSSDNVLNNYMLYRDTYYEMEEIYNKNDLYATAGVFDLEKIANVLPIMLLTDYDNDLNRLERLMNFGTADKKTLIRMKQVLYINNQDPSTSFCCEDAQISCQGTSSMNYPIKNLRLYTKDKAKGKYGDWDLPVTYTGDTTNPETMISMSNPHGSWKSKPGKGKIAFKSTLSGTFSEGERKPQAVNCWTLKADYAESSSSHNTGVARIWNKVMRDALLAGNPVSRTRAQDAVMNSSSKMDVRTCVDGFPIVIFHRYSEDDTNWKFVGKYNFNNDKSTESVFGFCDIPGIEYQEYDYEDITEQEFNEANANNPSECESKTFNYGNVDAMEKVVRKKVEKSDADELEDEDYFATFVTTAYEYSKPYQKALVYVGGVLNRSYFEHKIMTAGNRKNKNYCVEVLENEAPITNYTAPVSTFDTDWAHGFEFRYPEYDDKVSDPVDTQTQGGLTNLRRLYEWLHSTMYTQEAYDANPSQNIIIDGELKEDGDYVYKQTESKYANNGTYTASNYDEFKALMKKKFQKEKWDYLDVFKVAAYYIYLMRFGAVDQVCKNSMITSEGTESWIQKTNVTISGEGDAQSKTATVSYEPAISGRDICKWFFINYDNDTILGLDNDGQMSYGPDIDRKSQSGSGYWVEHDHPTEEMKGYWDEIANPTEEEAAGARTEYASLDEIRAAVNDGALVLTDGMKFLAGNTLYIWNQTAKTDYTSIDDLKRAVTSGEITPQKGDRYQIGGSVWEWSNDSAYAYAGHNSVLWNNLEDDEEFMTVVADMDQAIYTAGLKYNEVIKIFNEKQANMWCEKILNKDATIKYIDQYCNKDNNNLSKMHGPRTSHRMWWLSKRFTYFDSKFVSGEYMNAKILIKAQGIFNNPIFTVQPTEYMNYGWGVTSRSIGQTGISSVKDDQGHLLPLSFDIRDGGLSTSLSIGDVLEIYASPYLSEIDFSNFSVNLVSFDMTNMFNTVLGTQLKKLVLGKYGFVNSGSNGFKESDFKGLANADKLEFLGIESLRELHSLDLSQNINVKDLRAFDSGLEAITFANGTKIEHLELPSNFKTLILDGANYLSEDNIVFENDNCSNVTILTIKNCELLKNTGFEFLRKWYTQRNGNFAACSLDFEGFDWTIDYEDLDIIETLKNNCRSFNMKGSIKFRTAISDNNTSREEALTRVARVKRIFGPNCFDTSLNPPVRVDCPDFIIIYSDHEEVTAKEGTVVRYWCETYPSRHAGSSINYSILTDAGYETREGVTIVTDNLSGTAELTMDEYTLGANKNITIQVLYRWSGSNDFTSKMNLLIIDPTYPTSNSLLVLTGPTSLNWKNEYNYNLSVLGQDGKPATGTYSISWAFSDTESPYIDYENSGVVNGGDKYKVVTSDVEPEKAERVSLIATVTPLNRTPVQKEISLLLLNEDVILTSESNPVVMSVCRAAGWATNDDVLMRDEALAVTDIGTAFSGLVSDAFNFHEFEKFENVKSIPASAFSDCAITSIKLPSGVTQIGAHAFENCNGLTSIDFNGNNSITTIPNSAFLYCSSLENIVLPPTVRKIEAFAFGSTPKIKRIVILENTNDYTDAIAVPNALTDIEDGAFETYGYNDIQNNASIVTFYIPDGLGPIKDYDNNVHVDRYLLRSLKLREFIVSEHNDIYSSVDGVLFNKAQQTIYKYPANKSDVTDYVLPNGCLTLYDYCFYGTKLNSITLDNLTQDFGEHVFEASTNLTSIDMHMCQSMRNVGSYAFAGCSSLSGITYPTSIQHFGTRVFSGNTALSAVTLPEGTLSVSQYLIHSAPITELIMPDSIRYVVKADDVWRDNFYEEIESRSKNDAYIVDSCPNLETIICPKYMFLCGNLAQTCNSLKHVTLPVNSYDDEFGNDIVVNGSYYTRKYIAGSVYSITDYSLPPEDNGKHFFTHLGQIYQRDGDNIILVNVPYTTPFFDGSMIYEGTTKIADNCFSHNNTVTIDIPDTITEVGANVFEDCGQLLSIRMSKNVKDIKNRSFNNCKSLSSVVYPSTAVTKIGYNAFKDCWNLSSLTICSLSVPEIDDTNTSNFIKNGYHPFGTIHIDDPRCVATRNPSTFTGKNVTGPKKLRIAYFNDGTDDSTALYTNAKYWYDPLLNPVNMVDGTNQGGCGFVIEEITFNDDIYVAFFDRNGDQYEYAGTDTTQVPYANGNVMGIYQADGDYAGYYKFSFAAPVTANKPIQFTKGSTGDSLGTLRPQAYDEHKYNLNYGMSATRSGIKLMASEPVSDTVSRYDYDLLVSRLNSLETKLRNIAEK